MAHSAKEGCIRLKGLKNLRLARRLTQKQLADLLGISVRQITRYENGGSHPRSSLMARLRRVLQCTEIQLLRAPKAA